MTSTAKMPKRGRGNARDDAPGAELNRVDDALQALEAASPKLTPEWITEAPPPRQWLLRDTRAPESAGFLAAGIVGMLIAEGGVGKTSVACQLAVAVVLGGAWLDTFQVEAPARALLVLGEEPASEGRRRIYDAAQSMGATSRGDAQRLAAGIDMLALAGRPAALLDDEDKVTARVAALHEFVAAHGPYGLIVIDPLSRFAGPKAETDNAAGTSYIQLLEALANASGATVLCAHHTAKASRGGGPVDSAASRGSTAITDGSRWVLTLRAERLKGDDGTASPSHLRDIITASHTKSNYSRRADDVLLRYSGHGGMLTAANELEIELVERARSKERNRDRDDKRKATAEAKADTESGRAQVEDAILIRVVGSRPGIGKVDLEDALMAEVRRGRGECGRDRAQVAIARVVAPGGPVVIRVGSRKAKLHYLRDVPQDPLPLTEVPADPVPTSMADPDR